MQKIIRSIARCKICEDVIESKYTHDYVRCKCGAIFLDGGKEYQRYEWWPEKVQGKSRDEIIDFSFSEYEEGEW
ncbi:hypothetical protein FGY92_03370 [Staphylococcus hominis]|uniref:DUF7695 domain-containing protein n=1 Tax=Staphylococcus hominis TaxID=1290 RepID=UPI001F297911|nr:hypothetical protein [Staphylococcus hominis]UJB22697.1 hypothetical protein FGY92_03370 [Staphylococcus hominis]